MKKRGNQDFPFNDLSSTDNRLGVELARPAEPPVNDYGATGSREPTPNSSRPAMDNRSQNPKRYEDFSSLYEPPVSRTSRPASNNGSAYTRNDPQRSNRVSPPVKGNQTSYAGEDPYSRAPEIRKRTLNRQIQILSIIAGILFILCLVLWGFAIWGGRKDSVSLPAAGTSMNAVQQTTLNVSETTLATNLSTKAATVETTQDTTPAPDADPKSLANLPPSDENPVIALTFDDGPSGKLTPELLDVLKEKGVHVTFFLLGNHVADQDPTILKRMIDEGHEIGNHSYDHPSYLGLTEEQIRSQLKQTNDLIFNVIGSYPTVMRPPNGESNDTVLAVSKEMGMATINWSWETCPEDWLADHQTPEFISNHVINNAANGRIVLLHDIHECTVDSISSMVDGLKAKGYRFATCSELLGTLPNGMETGKVYYYGTA